MEGCYILENLAQHPGNPVGLVSRGSHHAVLSAMRAHEKNVKLQENSCFALLALARDLRVRRKMLEDGALEPLVKALDEFGGSSSYLARDAVDAIGNLVNIRVRGVNLPVDASEANRVCLKQIRNIVRARRQTVVGGGQHTLSNGPLSKDESDIAIVASNCMVTLACFQRNVHQLADMGVPRTMVQLMDIAGADHWQCELNCCLVIGELATAVPASKAEMIKAGVFPFLDRAKASDDARIRKAADVAAKALRSSDGAFEQLVATATAPLPGVAE